MADFTPVSDFNETRHWRPRAAAQNQLARRRSGPPSRARSRSPWARPKRLGWDILTTAGMKNITLFRYYRLNHLLQIDCAMIIHKSNLNGV